jgi:hypothetical protein
MKNSRESVMTALRQAREARDVLSEAFGGPMIAPPKGLDEDALIVWKFAFDGMQERLGALGQALGVGALRFRKAADLDKRIDDAKKRAKEGKAANDAAAAGKTPEKSREKDAAAPEKQAREPAPKKDEATRNVPGDADVALGGGAVKPDANLVGFTRATLIPKPGGGEIRNTFWRGGKTQRNTIGSVREAEFSAASAGGFSRDDAADMIAKRLVETLKTRWARFDVDPKEFERAELAIAEEVQKTGSNHHGRPAL